MHRRKDYSNMIATKEKEGKMKGAKEGGRKSSRE